MDNRTRIAIMCVTSFLLFALLAIFVASGLTEGFDTTLGYAYTSTGSGVLFYISLITHYLFGTESLFVITLIIASYLFYAKRKADGFMIISGMLLDATIVYLMKNLILRPRPDFGVIAESGFGFPSGHATVAIVFFGLLAMILFTTYKKVETRRKIEIGFGAAIAFIGFTRVYLGVHYFTDIFAGFLLGTSILCLTVYLFRKHDMFFSVVRNS